MENRLGTLSKAYQWLMPTRKARNDSRRMVTRFFSKKISFHLMNGLCFYK